MQQDPDFLQPRRGIAIRTDAGYQVMEGKGALVNRNSVIFAIGQGISLIGDSFYSATLLIWISAVTIAAAKTPTEKVAAAAAITAIQAGLFGAGYLAGFLIIPFVGVFVDRWNRRTTMIIADLAQAVLALLPLGAFLVAHNLFIPAIYVSIFLLTAAQGFFAGSQSGVLQVIVARKNFPQAVSILNILVGIGSILGALYAPTFFLNVGAIVAITFNAVSFLVSAVALYLLDIPKEAVHPYAFKQRDASVPSLGADKSMLGVLKDLWHGLRFVFSVRVLAGIAIMLVVVQIGAAAVNAVTTGFFLSNLHADPVKDLSLITALPVALGTGGLVGALLVGILARFVPLKALSVAGILGLGLGLIAIAFQTALAGGIVFFILTGVFNSLFTVSYGSLVLKVTPNRIIGRVEGILAPIATLTSFITAFGVGALVAAYNPTLNPHTPFPNPGVLFADIFIIGGLIIIVGGIIGLLLVRKAKEEVVGSESVAVIPAMPIAEAPVMLASDN